MARTSRSSDSNAVSASRRKALVGPMPLAVRSRVIGTVQQRVLFQDACASLVSAARARWIEAHAALQVPSHRRRKGDRQGCGVQAILLRRALLGESFQTPRHRTQREAVCQQGATQA